ncbi:MAG: dihydroorotate dehydrogenase [Thermodesulfobacteria bacterium]|nr:dihydroorotate dehydrogenase [Thermodesulfobacteriota bacterium]
MDLAVEIGPLKAPNPIFLASGTWGFGERLKDHLDLSSLGGLFTKGISLHPREGNPPPRLAETPCGLVNAIGLENPGVETFCQHIWPWLSKSNRNILVNVFGETIQEFLEVITKLSSLPLAGIELNISCPNVEKGGLSFAQDASAVKVLVQEVRDIYQGFLVVKLSPVGPVFEVAEAALSAGADALTAANTYPAMVVDLWQRKPALSRGFGGLSGPAVKPLTLKLVFELWQRFRAPIFGCGGITSGKDVLEYILCGASAVQVGTATLLDPQNPSQILQEIETVLPSLLKEGENLSSLRGGLKLDA